MISTKTHHSNAVWFAFLLAIPLRVATYVLSPIHEFMHAVLGTLQGQAVVDFTWTEVKIRGMNDITLAGAYFMEVILYAFIAAKFRTSWFSMFMFGALHGVILRGLTSQDLHGFPDARAGLFCVWAIATAIAWIFVVKKQRAIA